MVNAGGVELGREVRYMRDRISDKVDMLEQRLGEFAAGAYTRPLLSST